MRRMFLTLVVLALSVGGCQKQHPVRVRVDPSFDTAADKIAVFPFLSAIHEADDPDQIAPETMERHFLPALDARNDYKFVSPNTILYAVDTEGWQEPYQEFIREYPRSGKIDSAFFKSLADVLKVDAFLIPVVDVWQKDEVDYQENATPATYVGATITIVDKSGKKVMFQATDENYLEGARSETGDRGVVSTAGRVRSDAGALTHRAPPYEEVGVMVIRALVGSLPAR
jgi:hypothetical protein